MGIASLVIAGILAVVAGTLNAKGQYDSDTEEWNRLQKEQTRIDDAYALQLQQAEDDFKAAQDEAERNAKKGEAEADLADLGADITENAVSNDFNTAIDNLYLSQASDTWSWNNAAMQAGRNEGASFAALSGSGVRTGSSMSDAVLMESSLNSAQLQFSQDAKRRSDNNNLGGVLHQLAGNRYGIYQNRFGADVKRDDASWLRNSYLEGGNNYNLYQDALKIMDLRKTQEKERLQEKIDDIYNNSQMRQLAAFFGGASQGASTGYKASTTFYDAIKTYKTSLGDK